MFALPDRGRRMPALLARLRIARRAAARLTARRRRRAALLAAALFPRRCSCCRQAGWSITCTSTAPACPTSTPFIRFEPPTTGVVRDAHGTVLIELAREYRRVVTYDEVPLVMRQAIMAAEDKRFFAHAGVDYRALPRVIQKTTVRSLSEWWKGGHGFRLLLPQGGSTITQQLVRGYFLQDLTSRTDEDAIFHAGVAPPRILSAVLGASAANKLLRKMEEVRLTLWLEQEMRRRFGSQERAKREIFARYASFIYLGNGRYGFAAASEYYFGRPCRAIRRPTRGRPRSLAAISKSPRDYAPAAGNRRPLARRNQILALMARNGSIPAGPGGALPGRADPRGAPQSAQDRRAGGDRARPRRADQARRGPRRRRGPVPGADRGPLDRRRARAGDRERRPRARPGALREAAPRGEGPDPGIGGRAPQCGRGDPGRGRRAAGLPRSRYPLLRLQPRHRLAAPAGLRDEAAGVPGRVRIGPRPRHHGPRRADRGAAAATAASSGSPTTTTSSRARSRSARPWPSRATRWRCGSRARSACAR